MEICMVILSALQAICALRDIWGGVDRLKRA
jgi:hypothetical protein